MLRQLFDDSVVLEPKRILNLFYEVRVNANNEIIVFDDPIAAFVGFFYYAFKGYRKKYWMLEIYEHQLVINSIYRAARYLIFKIFGILALIGCDEIFVSSQLRRKYILEKYNIFVKRKPVKVVYNIPQIIQKTRLSDELYKKIKNFSNKKKVLAVYAGSIQYGRDIGVIVESFSKQTEYGLVLCGRIKDEYSKSRIFECESVLYLGELSYAEVLCVYESCHVGLLSYANEPMNVKYSAPVKMWEYLRANMVLIGNNNFALQTEWSEYISAYYGDGVGVCEAIRTALFDVREIKNTINIKFINPFE